MSADHAGQRELHRKAHGAHSLALALGFLGALLFIGVLIPFLQLWDGIRVVLYVDVIASLILIIIIIIILRGGARDMLLHFLQQVARLLRLKMQ